MIVVVVHCRRLHVLHVLKDLLRRQLDLLPTVQILLVADLHVDFIGRVIVHGVIVLRNLVRDLNPEGDRRLICPAPRDVAKRVAAATY